MTVMVLVALTPLPSAAAAVMVTVPAFLPETVPELLTVAMVVSDEDQLISV